MFNVEEVAEYTKISKKRIYEMIGSGQIPYKNIPGLTPQFDKDTIDDWLKVYKKKF